MRLALIALVFALSMPGFAQEAQEWEGRSFDWQAEVKLNYRDSSLVTFGLGFPFPDDFLDPGQESIGLRTADDGDSFEISNIALSMNARLGPKLDARLLIHVLDLYNRNPSSIDDRVFIREAWLRMGHADKPLAKLPGSTAYATIGKQPRFTKRMDRRLESYGLWGTAVGRFESTKLEIGGSLGTHLYWRGSYGNGNPLFMRDPNALAGDNGVPENVPGNPARPPFWSGFPILYDTLEQDVGSSDAMESGLGLGFRWVGENKDGVDILAWHFQRELVEDAELRGTYYGGDLEILDGAGIPLDYSGNDRSESGINLVARFGGFHLFAQYVDQDIAELERSGFETTASYRFRFPALMVVGDQPAFRWLEVIARYSEIDNDFGLPPMFVAPTFAWDWEKLDLGLRLGILRGLDLTVEFARHDMILLNGTALHPDEFLLTLRWAIDNR